MANSDPLEIRLVDPDLLTTHGILPLTRGDYYVQLNEPGSGNFEISADSELSNNVESDAFADVFYRGEARGGFLIENISRAHANAAEGGGRTVTASGRGALALLEDAIVWDDGTGSTERAFSGTQAATLITLIQEAQNRGGLQNLVYDFTATDDTDSVAWTDDEDLEFTVGTSLLDVIRQISDNGIDFDISRDGDEFTLHAYKNGAGSDKSSTIYFRVGQNCEEVSSDEVGGDIRNVLKTKYEGGYTTVSNSASINARRRREGLLDARYAQSTATARTFAAAHLDTRKDPKHQISIKVYDGVGPRVFVDYTLGDTITLDINGTETEYRIRGMHLHWDNSEYASVTLTMNDDIMENEIKLTRELNRLKTDFTSARDADLLEVSFWAAIGDPNISYNVKDMVFVGDILYVANGTSLLSYDTNGGGWTRLATVSNSINSIAAIGSDIYMCGGDKVYKYSGGTVTTIATVYYASDPGASLAMRLTVIGSDLFLGGTFSTVEGVAVTGVAKYSGGSWSDIAGGVGTGFYALETDGSSLFASAGLSIKEWDGATWSTLGSSLGTAIYSIAVYGTELLAGTTTNIYIWDGATWEIFEGGVSGNVYAIAVFLTDVFVGGTFTDRGSRIAKCSGGEWFELEEGVNGTVLSLAMKDDDLYVGGGFTTAGDKTAQGIAAYLQNFDSLADYLEHAAGMFNLGEAIHNATAKTSMTGADEIPLWDSLTSALRKITWTNIIASIKTWADTIYVSLTGNQTIAGVKTFSSDPLIPDEAYDATAWNGSLEPPTKNAVRDKIESMGGGGGTPGGSDTEVQYNDSGAFAGDAEFTWDELTKALGIGNPSLLPSISPDHTFWMVGDGVSPSQFMLAYGSSFAPFTTFMKADGSGATPTNVKDDQVIGRIRGRGYDGSGWTDTQLEIRFVADGDWGSGDTPTRIELWTCPDGSGTLTLAMTIGSDGNVNIASGKTYNTNGSPHAHAASDITSGTMATDRLGSGTADNTTFLRGDQTWATPAGGSSDISEYTIAVSVASNNITVALKDKDGNDPSSGTPVKIKIGNTIRTITSAVSITKNAGTDWFNAGDARFATKEIDYFVYLIWNTTPATDVIDIGFARIPYCKNYSEFSGTSTNEKYLAYGNASAPTSTDDVVVIGRFAATLSAGGSYNWSVPTFTSINLIQHPIYTTRILSWVPAYSASGSMTYTSVTTDMADYVIRDREIFVELEHHGTVGGTPNHSVIATAPFTARNVNPAFAGWVNTTGSSAIGGYCLYASGSIYFRRYDFGNWSAGSGRYGAVSGSYFI